MSFKSVIDRVEKKLQIWKPKNLSCAAKSTLIHTSSTTVPMYQMNCFRIPVEVSNKIDNIQRDFFWGKDVSVIRGIYPKAWGKVCIPKELGVMGFLNLRSFNSAMLAKINWRLVQDPDAMLAQVMKNKYYPEHSLLNNEIVCHATSSWGWKNINKEMPKIRYNSTWVVGNGKTIRIWEDWWCIEIAGNPKPLNEQSMSVTYVAELMECIGDRWK
ncbi:uncharacterized protein LOC113294766 [Papaver somniferum]|uniref:uncharacterized protein LOC113294766 n=1 Tax=Papaver somniferum TaxID=3469 RepID=UPI000E7054CA|nr:uncharacterized protein LOC113294766 [Papaver somniferum]